MSEEEQPAILHIVGKPLLERLKAQLRRNRNEFDVPQYTQTGGCDTCGWGSSETMKGREFDFEALCREIDAFGEELRKHK